MFIVCWHACSLCAGMLAATYTCNSPLICTSNPNGMGDWLLLLFVSTLGSTLAALAFAQLDHNLQYRWLSSAAWGQERVCRTRLRSWDRITRSRKYSPFQKKLRMTTYKAEQRLALLQAPQSPLQTHPDCKASHVQIYEGRFVGGVALPGIDIARPSEDGLK